MMADDFDNLWKKARTAVDEAESVQTLATILSSVDGQAFILNLEPSDAEACIGILDYVSLPLPYSIPRSHSPINDSGFSAT